MSNPYSDMCYKKCGNYIVTMKKLPDTRTNEIRSDVFDSKHAKFRADKLFVCSIEHEKTCEKVDEIENTFYKDKKVCYIVSQKVSVEDYNPDLNNVCAAGIHYFLSRESAFYWDIEYVQDGPYYKWYDNGQKMTECTFKNGDNHGLYQRWYKHGQKAEEGTYKNGKMHGFYKKWYWNGQKMEEFTYKNCEIHGLYLDWYENGKKKKECTYKNGENHGFYMSWYENGQKAEECTFQNDKIYGIYRSWYENGQKMIECTFQNGKLHGIYRSWCENGAIDIEITYQHGSYKKCQKITEWIILE